MNPEFQQQQQLPPVDHNRVVVLDSNTMLEPPSYPKLRRRNYQRRNSKVGRMFFESAAGTPEPTATSTCSNSLSSPEASIVAPASTLTTTTMNANITDTSLKPLYSIIRPSKYGTTHAKAAVSSSSPVNVKRMRKNWGQVPQLSGSSMSSMEEEEDQKGSLSRTSCRGGDEFTATGCPFARSSLTDDFCYDPECRHCCKSRRICIQ